MICQFCGKTLDKNKIVWLELDLKTGKYHYDDVPAEISQGFFPFGKTCALKVGVIYRHGEIS